MMPTTEQTLHGRYDKIDLPKVAPVVTRVERYARQCRCCGGPTLASLPEGLEPGTPFSGNIVVLALYLRFVHAVSYRRLSRLLLELFGLVQSQFQTETLPSTVSYGVASEQPAEAEVLELRGPQPGWQCSVA